MGFSEEQAIVLAEKFEAAAQATGEDLKGFIVAELDKRFAGVDSRFAGLTAEMERRSAVIETRLAEMEARFERSLRVLLVSILTAFVGVTGLAVAIIKLLP